MHFVRGHLKDRKGNENFTFWLHPLKVWFFKAPLSEQNPATLSTFGIETTVAHRVVLAVGDVHRVHSAAGVGGVVEIVHLLKGHPALNLETARVARGTPHHRVCVTGL